MLRASVLILSCALAGTAVAAPSAIKNTKTLEREQKKVEKKLIKAYGKLLKQLEKVKQPYYAYFEAKKALRLDPKNKKFKKHVPSVAPPPPIKPFEGIDELTKQINERAAKDLGEVLERAVEGGLKGDDLRPIAERVLLYDPDHAGARKALGFVGVPGRWGTPAQVAMGQAYKTAVEGCPEPKALEEIPWENLVKALGIELIAYEGQYCFAAGTKKAGKHEQLKQIVRAGDTAAAAMITDVFGGKTHFASPVDRPVPTGIEPGKFGKQLFLLLDEHAQQVKFLETCVTDENLKVSGRGLGFVNTGYAPDRVLISLTFRPGGSLLEWPAQRMAIVLTAQAVGQNRPYYLVMGLARYYSGYISGQSLIRYVPSGSKTERQLANRTTDFFQLRALCRKAYNEFAYNPPLEAGFNRDVNSMRREDNAVACAFVEFLLATDRAKLIKLLADGDAKVRKGPELISHVFGGDGKEVDAKFLEWMLKNY